jgi:hypothetical protein
MHWRCGAAAKLRALGAELEQVKSVYPEVDVASEVKFKHNNDSASQLAASALAEATSNGYWPHRSADGVRPRTSDDHLRSSKKEPPVLDRIFSGPFALGTTDKYKKAVKKELEKEFGERGSKKWTKTPTRAVTAQIGGRQSNSTMVKADASSPVLHSLAKAVFSNKSQKFADGPVQKLTHAEKLHLMIMQVKDLIDEGGDENRGAHDIV